jgi:hypothetical protein
LRAKNLGISGCFGPPEATKRKATEMRRQTPCNWMSGPKDAALKVSAAKWWLAISRDALVKDIRRQSSLDRSPVRCRRTPTFSSPIENPTP